MERKWQDRWTNRPNVDCPEVAIRGINEPLRKAQFHADRWFAECDAIKARLQDALDKLKPSVENVSGLESMMRELQSAAQAALNAAGDEAQGRERVLTKFHEAQIAELQARAPPTFGASDRALEDGRRKPRS